MAAKPKHLGTLHDYLQVVDATPMELEKLCKDILISVTAFFRDREAFARLDKVLANILAGKPPGDDIRVWIAGYASGEEARWPSCSPNAWVPPSTSSACRRCSTNSRRRARKCRSGPPKRRNSTTAWRASRTASTSASGRLFKLGTGRIGRDLRDLPLAPDAFYHWGNSRSGDAGAAPQLVCCPWRAASAVTAASSSKRRSILSISPLAASSTMSRTRSKPCPRP